ncbi:MAG: FAD binding domain-containing protein [Candidatus Marinimicrobia bacterium]|nr:FAD binding domain-containing protein [Candidatus Neomarinimicrobiota bacterium]
MNNLKWYFPKAIDEATELMKKEKVLPHASGTGLLKRNLSNLNGLINLSDLELQYSKQKNDTIEFGSMNTYADIIAKLSDIDENNILVKSLQNSADTPLRNRITIGGSIAFAPPWSDIIGALIALETEIVLAGQNVGAFPIAEYLRNSKLKKNSLITGIKFKLSNWETFSHREIRTKKDMPIFHIVIMLKIADNRIQDSKIIITGTTNKFDKLNEIEKYLTDTEIDEIEYSKIEKMVDVKFSKNRISNPEYSNKLVAVELSRGIQKLVRKNK